MREESRNMLFIVENKKKEGLSCTSAEKNFPYKRPAHVCCKWGQVYNFNYDPSFFYSNFSTFISITVA